MEKEDIWLNLMLMLELISKMVWKKKVKELGIDVRTGTKDLSHYEDSKAAGVKVQNGNNSL